MGQEGLKGLLSGGVETSQIFSLSLCYCGLGSWSGTLLASLLTNSSVRYATVMTTDACVSH